MRTTTNSTKVAIYETDVYGVKAYHAKCLECGWETKRFSKQSTAVRHGEGHGCQKGRKS